MPDFVAIGNITVQPKDVAVPYRFPFSPCTGADTNDGSLPYNDSIATFTVTAHKAGETDPTSLIASSSRDSNTIIVNLSWPGTAGDYHLTFVITTTLGAVIEFDFNRVVVEDK